MMPEESAEQLRATIAAAQAHAASQREEARRLEARLPELNARLGAARLRQEHLQQPTTLATEAGRQRLDHWLVRLRIGRGPT